MDEDRLNDWRRLLERALAILDAAAQAGGPLTWSFGGGTVLMLRHRHRYSHDVDIFLPDPQWLGYLSPRLNPAAESLAGSYVEGAEFLKLSFPEGEIDFVAAGWLTPQPFGRERHFGRDINVETSAEIVAKKLWFRAESFKARDLYDLATVIERDPAALREIAPLIREKVPVILGLAADRTEAMREEFEALERFEEERTIARCIEIVRRHLGAD
jgi:hypothetical protein